MVGVTTVALLERKRGISRSLFSRYWRDVHGVMAARIPGFDTYTQYHVTAMQDAGSEQPEPFAGIAVVTFASEEDRAGLVHSEITPHIHRDEQNVFRRALLYNLAAGASVTRRARIAEQSASYFLLLPVDSPLSLDAAATLLDSECVLHLASHDLSSGDPGAWNDTDVDDRGAGRRFAGVLQADWPDAGAALQSIRRVVAAARGQIAAYRVDAAYLMVDGGRPTQLGLRGLDAVRTIEEAGAVNQLEPDIVRAIYGAFSQHEPR